MKRRTLPALVLGASAALVVPLGVTASTAAWNDREWVHGSGIGTSSIDCGVDADFAAMASGRFLSGTLLGADLDGIAALQPMDLARDSAGTLDVSPPDAVSLGSTPPTSTYADPLAISALGGIVGLDLTGLQVGLPAARSAGCAARHRVRGRHRRRDPAVQRDGSAHRTARDARGGGGLVRDRLGGSGGAAVTAVDAPPRRRIRGAALLRSCPGAGIGREGWERRRKLVAVPPIHLSVVIRRTRTSPSLRVQQGGPRRVTYPQDVVAALSGDDWFPSRNRLRARGAFPRHSAVHRGAAVT